MSMDVDGTGVLLKISRLPKSVAPRGADGGLSGGGLGLLPSGRGGGLLLDGAELWNDVQGQVAVD